ncbi:MAG: response regulator [Cyanobacteria bacterium CRU_2_1]|nr:response regulator [Cyanobacteria bacterium RU_5_0]NJR63440.1 response regulator [Cyanobacteria bacterium CRU_2_1]
MKILLVEDDEPTIAALTAALTADRYAVNIATDGQMGLALAEAYDYDLVLLDVLIPKLDGISVCRSLRSGGYQMPILLLTAKDSQTDKIVGLDAGADDYMVKPFDLAELRARIRALLRRGGTSPTAFLTWEHLRLDPNISEVTYNHNPIVLTPKEFGILELFLRHPQRVFSRSAIIDRLWSMDVSPAESAVTTHIKDLRQKLKAGGMTLDLIETVYGLGYRLKPPPDTGSEDSESKTQKSAIESQEAELTQSAPLSHLPIVSSPPFSVPPSVLQVLDRFRNSFAAQINVLVQVKTALQDDRFNQELRHYARQEAHKLSGSLGIFGYPEGSHLAQQVEHLLMDKTSLEQAEILQLSTLITALQTELAKPPIDSTDVPSPLPPPSRPLILAIDDDVKLIEQLQAAALSWGMRVEVVSSLGMVHQTVALDLPDAILLNLTLSNTTEHGLRLLAELTQQHPTIPVLVFTGRDSLADRVEVSRLGGKGYLHKSLPVERIMQAIAQALPQPYPSEAKVLVVDDDPMALAILQAFLQPWGLNVITLENPQQFWEVLTATMPDLVLVDLEMPTFSGIDLCQVVRQDPQWGDLPILVVTAHIDAKSIQQVFAAGADDYIAKPVVGPELVTRIISRIERVRLQRKRVMK